MSQPEEFSITCSATDARSLRVAVSGDLDMVTSPVLQDELSRQMCAERRVLLDLSEVTFMDSSGLDAVLTAVKAAQANGWSFGVAGSLSQSVRRIMEITGVLALLPVVEE